MKTIYTAKQAMDYHQFLLSDFITQVYREYLAGERVIELLKEVVKTSFDVVIESKLTDEFTFEDISIASDEALLYLDVLNDCGVMNFACDFHLVLGSLGSRYMDQFLGGVK